MKWPAYPKYKDSGVDWLGEVPEEWALQKLKTVSTLTGGGTPSKDNLNYWTNGQILWVSPKDMTSQIITDAEDSITEQAVRESTTNYIEEGMPLLVVRSGILKHTIPVAIAGCRLTINQDMKAFSFDNIITPRFFTFWVEGNNGALLFAWRQLGATVESIDIPAMQKTLFPIPQKDEQKSIVAYLEIETGKIDFLIAEQEKLITLLQEKRQAIISHAVTKGLNSDAPVKDSGVEWLGSVPEGWVVVFFKQVISVIESGTSVNAVDEPASDEEFGILKTSCVYERDFRSNENKTVLHEEYQRLSCPLQKGCLIVSRMNTPELVGAAGVVEEERNNIFLPDRLWQLHTVGIDVHYLWYWTQSSFYKLQIKQSCNGTSSSMQNLAQDQFKNILVSQPSIAEQNIIVEFLKKETTKIDDLIMQSRNAIELLRERRTALISAVVTGKIDVRGLTTSEPA